MTGGVRTAPVTLNEDVYIAPIDPVSLETVQRYVLDTPTDLLESFVPEHIDVQDGDQIFVYDTETTYAVKKANKWMGSHSDLLLERIKSRA